MEVCAKYVTLLKNSHSFKTYWAISKLRFDKVTGKRRQ